MKIERLRENNKKQWIIGIIIFILLVSTIALVVSRAKYKVTQKIQLVNGTINYSKSDVNIVALYVDNAQTNSIPATGTYGIDQTNSFCTTDGSSDKEHKDNNVTISIINNKISVSNVTKKNTKCFVYLKKLNGSTVQQIIATLGAKEQTSTEPNFNNLATTDEGVYYAQDNDGTTYYYRGKVTNNYLKFAEFWWRIIRFNGDGSIRIIYDGTQYHANGTSEEIFLKGLFANTGCNTSECIGYMYTINDRHGHTLSSNAKTQLDTWYTSNLKSYEEYIDKNAGFCGDRSLISGTGIGNSWTSYGASQRVFDGVSIMPTFNCPESTYDLYTTSSSSKGNKALTNPIGLITADELIFAGTADEIEGYLYNRQYYWTMTPGNTGGAAGSAALFSVWGDSIENSGSSNGGLRPVINLKPNVVLSGNGTQNTPYQVVGLS